MRKSYLKRLIQIQYQLSTQHIFLLPKKVKTSALWKHKNVNCWCNLVQSKILTKMGDFHHSYQVPIINPITQERPECQNAMRQGSGRKGLQGIRKGLTLFFNRSFQGVDGCNRPPPNRSTKHPTMPEPHRGNGGSKPKCQAGKEEPESDTRNE